MNQGKKYQSCKYVEVTTILLESKLTHIKPMKVEEWWLPECTQIMVFV